MNLQIPFQVVRKLTAAEGYLDLNMPQQALEELNEIDGAGPYRPVVDLMRGTAFKSQERYDDAIESFKRAAEAMPAPHSTEAWMSLTECFRLSGREEIADKLEAFVKSNASTQDQFRPTLNISITIHHAPPKDIADEEPDIDEKPDVDFDPEMN